MQIRHAIISVSEKKGLEKFASGLEKLGVHIISTGGTGEVLRALGVHYSPVSDVTGFPEILDGRVKTLHPKIHAGILARTGDETHKQVLARHGISPIHLVVVNLYPFRETVSKASVSFEEAVENIDIGGPTLIRAAAKNCESVTVLVDPEDYPSVYAEMKANEGQVSQETRFRLARKAFHHTAQYDLAIAAWMDQRAREFQEDEMPHSLGIDLRRKSQLRYGENPHQRAALYVEVKASGLAGARQLQGKQLSFNNYLDLQAASQLVNDFEETACAIIKHTNPCGVATASMPDEAYRRALECDPVSAFGSIVAYNRTVNAETAVAMRDLFVEAIIAPSYARDALKIFSKKKNLRVMELEEMGKSSGILDAFDLKTISGGLLVQDRDSYYTSRADLKVVSRRRPTEEEFRDLLFSWIVCKHVKSNAIVYARDGRTLGIGAGQMSRVDSARLAGEKAQLALEGGVMASDAFFPFRDGIDTAHEFGIRAVIQPGGSVRDSEVIEAIDEYDMAMVFTRVRHFRH